MSEPRSVTRMKTHTDPGWAASRIIELEAEVAVLREALGSILVHEYNGVTDNENMRSIARQALDERRKEASPR